ncbi:MAG: glycosyltransferase [Flavobacteriaceae bacterium]|jgi:glycosyltransferase involved in cell wall biosynthesis|nr:glycosyltransferase [Flavobacteriaceae bacterium]
MSKVLIVVPNDILGGAEQYLKNIAVFLAKEGYSVDVFFLKASVGQGWSNCQKLGISCYFTKNKRELTGVFGLLINLLKYGNKEYDYIYTSHVHVNSYINFLRRIRIVKSKYHIARESTSIFLRYSGIKAYIYKLHYKYNYSKIDLLICQSKLMYDQLMNVIPKLNRISQVIPNLINLEVTSSDIFKVEDKRYIVSAGRLIEEKGFDLLIEAFDDIRVVHKDIKLIILGEGKKRVDLEKLIEDRGLEDVVELKGFVKDVYPFFRGAEVCVVSSRLEGFPNVVLQMMLSNNKVASTLCAGGIEDLKGVVTCNTNDIQGLKEVILKLLNQDKCEYNRKVFDLELESRSISNFIKKIAEYL